LGREVSLVFAQSKRSDQLLCPLTSAAAPPLCNQACACASPSRVALPQLNPLDVTPAEDQGREQSNIVWVQDSCGRCRKSRTCRTLELQVLPTARCRSDGGALGQQAATNGCAPELPRWVARRAKADGHDMTGWYQPLLLHIRWRVTQWRVTRRAQKNHHIRDGINT
jgi:hypothetical protein